MSGSNETLRMAPPDGMAALRPEQLQYTSFFQKQKDARQFLMDAWENPKVRRGLEIAGAFFALVEGERLLHNWHQAYSQALAENDGKSLTSEQLKNVALATLRSHIHNLGEKLETQNQSNNQSPTSFSQDKLTSMPPPTAPIHLSSTRFDGVSATENRIPDQPQARRRGLKQWWVDSYYQEPLVHLLTDQYNYYSGRLREDPIRLALVRRGIYPDHYSQWKQNAKEAWESAKHAPARFRNMLRDRIHAQQQTPNTEKPGVD